MLIRGDAEVIDEVDEVLQVLKQSECTGKMFGSLPEGVDDVLRPQRGMKRIVIRVTVPNKFSSWDHAKLGGKY